jgi:hypothetical protein
VASGGLFSGLFSSSGDGSAKSASSGGVLDKMSRLFHGSDPVAEAAPAAKAKTPAKATQTASAAAGAIRPKPQVQPPAPQPDAKSAAPAKPQATPAEAQPTETASNTNLLRGAQATVPAGSFDSRWGAMR